MDIRPEQAQSTGTDKYQHHQAGPQVGWLPPIEVVDEPGETVEDED